MMPFPFRRSFERKQQGLIGPRGIRSFFAVIEVPCLGVTIAFLADVSLSRLCSLSGG